MRNLILKRMAYHYWADFAYISWYINTYETDNLRTNTINRNRDLYFAYLNTLSDEDLLDRYIFCQSEY